MKGLVFYGQKAAEHLLLCRNVLIMMPSDSQTQTSSWFQIFTLLSEDRFFSVVLANSSVWKRPSICFCMCANSKIILPSSRGGGFFPKTLNIFSIPHFIKHKLSKEEIKAQVGKGWEDVFNKFYSVFLYLGSKWWWQIARVSTFFQR